jgi:hypothetical protein
MTTNKLPPIGHATQEEKEFTHFLLDTIADYIEKIPTDRRTLIAALSRACQIVFCQQTHFDVKQQCEEIDDFCAFLKSYALKDAKRS